MIAVLFIYLISRNLDLDLLHSTLKSISPTYIACGLVLFFLGYGCRIARWKLMLTTENPIITWQSCLGPMFISVAANNILPFRAGDLIRSFAFNSKLNISASTSIATLFAERILDLTVVLIALEIALMGYKPAEFSQIYIFSKNLIPLLILCLMGLLFYPGLAKAFISPFFMALNKLNITSIAKLEIQVLKGLQTLSNISSHLLMLKLFCWSLLAWMFEGLVFFFCALSIPSITNPIGSFLALPLSTLATAIPSTPGYVGTFDFFSIRAMMGTGNSLEASTAFTIALHLLLYIPPTLVGGIFALIYFYPKKLRN